MLVEMSKNPVITLVGLNYKEVRGDGGIETDKMSAGEEKRLAIERAKAWFRRYGDPYALSALDLDGRAGIDYGVYGVPETYVIDKTGVIRLKHIGPVTSSVYSSKILPLVEALNQ